jgi:branched-chain amino acid transport system permease protein
VPEFIAQTLNGLTLAGIIFLVSSGFTLVFGVMRVTNLSHGAVYLVGGYIGYSVISATHNFFYGLAAGALAMAAFGYLLERTLISWLGRSEMAELLATLGLIYVLDDLALAIWGGSPVTINLPGFLGKSSTLPGGIVYPNGRFFILIVAAAVAAGLYYLLRRTRIGAILRAGVDDRDMVSALGINVRRVLAFVFTLGALLAGFAGVLGGTVLGLYTGANPGATEARAVTVIMYDCPADGRPPPAVPVHR